MITIGSCFAGIGGFELGLERGISNSKTVWQIEQNKYCQGILKKHWPKAILHNDIREIDYDKIQTVDIICGGFPCQGVSCSGKGKGIEGDERSGLWRQMHRLINHLQPRVAVMENVPALLWKGRGMHVVMSDLASIGYDAEWCTISARQFGAPHLRKRVFIVAYPNSPRTQIQTQRKQPSKQMSGGSSENRPTYWHKGTIKSGICRVDDGISGRVDRIKALGNAIVPQCSEYIGRCIWESGLLH
tara:strand:- start:104 stop:835 length:732 start_codon:yes stop_codon:yes gene_type:complete